MKQLKGAVGKWNLSTIYRCGAESVTVYIVDSLSFPTAPFDRFIRLTMAVKGIYTLYFTIAACTKTELLQWLAALQLPC